MTISQERTVLTTTAAGRVEFATAGARRGAGCPWLVQGEIRRGDGVREELYIIAEPTEPTQRGGMGAKFIAAIRDVYAASTHDDPIVALTAAIEAANDALFHSNRSAAPGLRVVLGLTCLLVREHDLIICQVPPTQLLLAQNGAPVILPSFDSWRADYQPHESGDQQGLGATETATPLLFRAVLEEGDLIVLCSTNLARLLANDDDDHLGPLLGNDPREAAEFLRERAERNGLDPAYGMVIAPEPATSPAGSAPARGYDDDAEEGWDDAEDEAPQPRTGERWIDRSLREMREWSRVIPWRRRGGGRIVPLRRARAAERSAADETDERYPAAQAVRYEDEQDEAALRYDASHRPTLVTDEIVDEDEGEAPHAYEPAAADYPDDEDETEEPSPPPHRRTQARVAGRAAARPRSGVLQMLGAVIAFGFVIVGSALERVLPAGGRRKNERFLERSRNRVWPLGNLERHATRGPRIGRALPLVALVAVLVAGVVLTVSVRNRQIRGEQQRFDTALTQISQQRETALGSADKLAAYNQLLVLPAELDKILGAEKTGRPERIAAERAAIAGAVDQVAGVERLSAEAVQLVTAPPAAGVTGSGRLQIVAHEGKQFALIGGIVYNVDPRAKALTRILGKGDNVGGVSVGQVVGIVWRVDTLFAFTETQGFVLGAAGWTTTPLAATGRKATAVESFDGNLYFLEPERGQIVKFASGSYAQAPQPWSSTKGTTDLSLALDITIDRDIYILLSDGRILDYYQGEMKNSFAPTTVPPLAGANAIATTEEGRWLYLVDPKEGRIVRVGRDGNLAGVYKPADGVQGFAGARDIAVDKATGTIYLLTDAGVVSVRLP
jgi:hypothetical protein